MREVKVGDRLPDTNLLHLVFIVLIDLVKVYEGFFRLGQEDLNLGLSCDSNVATVVCGVLSTVNSRYFFICADNLD